MGFKSIFKNRNIKIILLSILVYILYDTLSKVREGVDTKNIVPKEKKIYLFWKKSCRFSKRIMPLWDAFQKKYPEITNKVEEEEDLKLIDFLRIEAYPTIALVTSGENNKYGVRLTDYYEGERSMEGLVHFAEDHSLI